MSGLTKSVRSKLWSASTTVKFGEIELEPTAAANVALSPDGKAILAVCLNHTLRAWNTDSGRLTAEASLLAGDKDQRNQLVMPPTQKSLIQVVDQLGQAGDLYYIVAYVPHEKRFRFWAMLDTEVGEDTLREVHPDLSFIPPIDEILDTSIWILEEFYIIPGSNWQRTRLWLRARSGPVSRALQITFNLFDSSAELADTWSTGWQSVSHGFQGIDSIAQHAPAEFANEVEPISSMELSEKWLDFLLWPGRFSSGTLETAISTYAQKNKVRQIAVSNSKNSLRDRIDKIVAAGAASTQSEAITRIAQNQILVEQWHSLFSLIKELHKLRGENLSLVIDPEDQLPWISCADAVAPVRTCASLESWTLNQSKGVLDQRLLTGGHESDHAGNTHRLLTLASSIRDILPSTYQDDFRDLLSKDALEEPSLTPTDRLEALHKDSALSDAISNDDYDKCLTLLEQAQFHRLLTVDSINSLLSLVIEAKQAERRMQEEITAMGRKQLLRTTQEAVALNLQVIADVCLLILFVFWEVHPDDVKAVPDVTDTGDLYAPLIEEYQRQLSLDFLAKKTRTLEKIQRRRSDQMDEDGSPNAKSRTKESKHQTISTTLLESMFMSGWRQLPTPSDMSLMQLLTMWPRWWIATLDLHERFEDFTAHVFADLIKNGDHKLAYEFLPHVSVTPWSTYLKGRLFITTGDCKKAAPCFRDSALSLGKSNCVIFWSVSRLIPDLALGSFDINAADTAELVDPYERESFTAGLALYYKHVLSLFAYVKAHAYTADFAALALEALNQDPSSGDAKLEEDLASRLFTASLHTSRFDQAYSALSSISNPALRKANLQTFMQTLINQGRNDLLLSYPYTTMAADADAVLASLASKSTLQTATKYYNTLYFFRMHRGNLKGAAQASFHRLRHLQSTLETGDVRIQEAYLITINALACLSHDEAWIISEAGSSGVVESHRGSGVPISFTKVAEAQKRVARAVLTLADLRIEYQAELDRVSDLEGGRFAFGGDGDRMDVL